MIGRRQRVTGNLTLFCGGVVLLALVGRLVHIQYLEHHQHLRERDDQSQVCLPEFALRGSILDRNGEKLALSRVQVKSLYVMPHKVGDPEVLADTLAGVLSMDRDVLLKIFAKDKKFAWIKRKLNQEEFQALSRTFHPALGFRDEQKRYYPKGKLASHILGFVGVDNKGLEGVEAQFDKPLRGQRGFRWVVKDAFQNILDLPDKEARPAVDGYTIWLTLDHFIQHVVEEELRRAQAAWAPQSSSLIIMSPRSGEVLAMANWPSYDPSHLDLHPADGRRNRAITDPYEPGSTFKPFAIAAALDAGTVTPDTLIHCGNGAYTFVSGKIRRTIHDYHPYGKLTVTDVLGKSSNVGTTKVALKMPERAYLASLTGIDVESPTGIELPGEAGGWVAPKGWSFYSATSVPWGQEVAMTPLKLLVSFNALVNGGEMMKPSILRMMTTADGEVIEAFAPCALRRIVSERTSSRMRAILHHTVEKGTGKRARVEGYTVGGKTGTKTKLDRPAPSEGGTSRATYSMRRSVCSFICCAPADDPVVSLIVVLDEPSKGAQAHYLTGGKVAAPIAGAVLAKILPYLGVPRETSEDKEE